MTARAGWCVLLSKLNVNLHQFKEKDFMVSYLYYREWYHEVFYSQKRNKGISKERKGIFDIQNAKNCFIYAIMKMLRIILSYAARSIMKEQKYEEGL